MDWFGMAAAIFRRLPVERWLIKPRDTTKSLEDFAASLKAPQSQKQAPSEQKATVTTQEPPYISPKVEAGTACTLCSDEHFSEVSGALSEALRFARDEGLGSKEVIRRVRHARDELNTMERFDLAPEEIAKLPEDEKEVARWALPQSRSLRHMINGIRSVSNLEQTAAKAATVADEFADRLIKCKPGYFETKAGAMLGGELPPEIKALKKMVEERKRYK